jgi:hypothetical protein
MADDDARRVEARLGSAGRGLSATPENIEALREQQLQRDKLNRPPPAQPFAAVLKGAGRAAPPPAPAKADAKAKATGGRAPTPRPGLRRPSVRDDYGVDAPTPVVIKA